MSNVTNGVLSHGGKSVPLCVSKPAMPFKNCSCAAQETSPRPLFVSSPVSRQFLFPLEYVKANK
jgi:hypothetical protein